MRKRLVLMASGTTSMVVFAFLVPLGIAVQTLASNQALNEAETEARSLAPAVATVKDPPVLAELVRSAGATSIGRLSVFMPDGTLLGASATADADVSLALTGRSFTTWTADGADVLVPVVIPQAGVAVIEVAVPNSRLRRGVLTAWLILTVTGVGLVLLAVFVADSTARSVVLPTRALAHAARQAARGDLRVRVAPAGPMEVADVGRAFNLLVARIAELLHAEREAAADLSHTLRTPLTALRLDVESLPPSPAADRLDADVGAVEEVVSQVIRGLRDQTKSAMRDATDLVSTVRSRLGFWTALAQEHHRTVGVDIAPHHSIIPIAAREADAMVDVLLGNVFAHTSPGTPFGVSIREVSDTSVAFVVDDEGPGFPSDMIERGASGASSTGLGLDIVRRTAEAAGGSLSISMRPDGGARVEVVLTTMSQSRRSKNLAPGVQAGAPNRLTR